MIYLLPVHLIVSYWSYKRLFYETGKLFFVGFIALGALVIYYFQIGFILVFFVHSILIIIARNKNRILEYENSKAIFEGGGIMRGLTSVEAAILIDIPLHEVLSLLFAELAIKKIIKVGKFKPFRVTVSELISLNDKGENLQERKEMRKIKAQENNLVIFPFEDDFIEYLEQNLVNNFSDLNFTFLVEPLVERVADRVAGFDLSQTILYYQQIIERVVGEIGAGDFLFLSDADSVLKNIGWLMLDNSYRDNLLGKSGDLIPTLTQYENQIPLEIIRLLYGALSFHEGKYNISFKLGRNINLTTAQFLADTNRATFSG